MSLGAAMVLTVLSACAVNLGYVLEQRAAAALPPLSARRPLEAVRLLVGSRAWLKGFATETGGFACYVAALALAPLSLVQSVSAGGVAVLAFLVARTAHQPLGARELAGVVAAVLGLFLLGISLSAGHGGAEPTRRLVLVVWLVLSALAAGAAILGGGRRYGGAGLGAAAGILFAAGDVSTKAVVAGGWNLLFVPALVGGYMLGTSTLQLAFQRAGALTTAGLATLLTNALPIVAASVVFGEPVPDGVLGVVRVAAFVCVVAGGALLARPSRKQGEEELVPA